MYTPLTGPVSPGHCGAQVWGLLSNLLGQDPENSRLIAESPFLDVLLMYIQR